MSNTHRTKDGRYSFTLEWPCKCGHGLEYHTAEKPRACGNYGTGLIKCDCREYKPARKSRLTVETKQNGESNDQI